MKTDHGINKSSIGNILLVEDDSDDVRLIQRAFKKSSLQIDLDIFDNGRDAIRFLKGSRESTRPCHPDIVILDLNLPGLDGHGVLKAIRSDSKLTKLPVVILTTSKNELDIANCYEQHANCYINKPSDLNQFTDVVKKIESFWLNTVQLPVIEKASPQEI